MPEVQQVCSIAFCHTQTVEPSFRMMLEPLTSLDWQEAWFSMLRQLLSPAAFSKLMICSNSRSSEPFLLSHSLAGVRLGQRY